MDRGTWWATVRGIAESDATEQLTRPSTMPGSGNGDEGAAPLPSLSSLSLLCSFSSLVILNTQGPLPSSGCRQSEPH